MGAGPHNLVIVLTAHRSSADRVEVAVYFLAGHVGSFFRCYCALSGCPEHYSRRVLPPGKAVSALKILFHMLQGGVNLQSL